MSQHHYQEKQGQHQGKQKNVVQVTSLNQTLVVDAEITCLLCTTRKKTTLSTQTILSNHYITDIAWFLVLVTE